MNSGGHGTPTAGVVLIEPSHRGGPLHPCGNLALYREGEARRGWEATRPGCGKPCSPDIWCGNATSAGVTRWGAKVYACSQ